MDTKKVLATVGEIEITQTDFDYFLKNLPPQTASQLDSDEGRKNLLQELINQELIYLDAKDKGLDNEEAYRNEIERLSSNMLKQYSISKLFGNIDVSENDVKEFYSSNTSQFSSSESIKASHILVDSEIKAHEVLKEIKNSETFEDAARKHSKCPSASSGGDLGYFTKGQMVPEFEKTAFETAVGEISKPVQTQFGYHIIKVFDRKPAVSKTYDEVKDMIRQYLLSNRQQDIYYSAVSELKKKYEVKISP